MRRGALPAGTGEAVSTDISVVKELALEDNLRRRFIDARTDRDRPRPGVGSAAGVERHGPVETIEQGGRMSDDGISRRHFSAAPLIAAAAVALGADEAQAAAAPGPLTADDRFALEDLFARYCWSYDCSDEPAYLALFTDDAIGVGYPEFNEVYRTRDALLGWFRFLQGLREKEGDDWQHVAYNHRVEGDGARCLIYSYATHFNSNRTTKVLGVRSAGYFVAECVKQQSAWLFRRFSINHWDRTQPPWKKPLPWANL